MIKESLNSIIQLIFERLGHHFDDLARFCVFCLISNEIRNDITQIISNKLLPTMKIAELVQLQIEDSNNQPSSRNKATDAPGSTWS